MVDFKALMADMDELRQEIKVTDAVQQVIVLCRQPLETGRRDQCIHTYRTCSF